MKTIFHINGNGMESKNFAGKTYFIVDGKEFLQGLYSNLLTEKVEKMDKHISNITKTAFELIKQQYEIADNKNKDMIDLFLSMDKESIKNSPSLMEAHLQSLALKKLTNSPFLTKEEQRIVHLVFFNDICLKSLINNVSSENQMQKLEKQSLQFQKTINQQMKVIEQDNQTITKELTKPYYKQDIQIFDGLLEDWIHNNSVSTSIKKAYTSCQSLIPFEKGNKKSKIASILKPSTQKAVSFDKK